MVKYQLAFDLTQKRASSQRFVIMNTGKNIIQGSTNCAYGDERARNVHAKRFLRA